MESRGVPARLARALTGSATRRLLAHGIPIMKPLAA
jgi:hypothetical protein